ncbi:phage head completion/stabilization protein [Aeromonas caviae]|uniref:Phage head completion/stabilization protein n=1 Tax=Aeromonas caviae TaxID=648 RepID=A0ABD0BGP1_AERCA|nr:head completion/stabilization protein [Aeromonas caviae]MDX7782325.1 head completion/stabilization protein [Aeromonas caviae]BCR27481.1 phage head completion/stabilization protein [Aeromonas caviae]GJA97358.1 phage head completion/stabilization protein [Aeromonas caviae]GJB13945.1 phage head completion/stabilization protein [Aeromonas caviae]GJB39888.1 phage head completion/stabilization protein [Aeromonas caviae]
MSTGFIANATTSPAEGEIDSTPFWPAISLPDLRDTVRLDGTVTTARLKHAVIDAITSVNRDLADWRRAREAEGVATLAAVPGEVINGESAYLHSYRRAVYAMTRANLLERYTDYSATGDGVKGADAKIISSDDLYRDARFAIRDILGTTHITVALI